MNVNDRQTTDAQNQRSGRVSMSGCCGGPAPAGTSACCEKDASVKAAGGTGCGCGSAPQREATMKSACCN